MHLDEKLRITLEDGGSWYNAIIELEENGEIGNTHDVFQHFIDGLIGLQEVLGFPEDVFNAMIGQTLRETRKRIGEIE